MKLDKVEKQKARETNSLFTFFPLPLPTPSVFLTISAHRWLQPFDVNAGQLHTAVIKTGNRAPRHVRAVTTAAVGKDYSSLYS